LGGAFFDAAVVGFAEAVFFVMPFTSGTMP
jgi:hypothetical protein